MDAGRALGLALAHAAAQRPSSLAVRSRPIGSGRTEHEGFAAGASPTRAGATDRPQLAGLEPSVLVAPEPTGSSRMPTTRSTS